MRALVFEQFGGPEVLHLREVADPVPAADEVLVRTRAIGLNFADVYRRQGHYHLAGEPPWIAGYEAAGDVVSAPAGSDLRRAIALRSPTVPMPMLNSSRSPPTASSRCPTASITKPRPLCCCKASRRNT